MALIFWLAVTALIVVAFMAGAIIGITIGAVIFYRDPDKLLQ